MEFPSVNGRQLQGRALAYVVELQSWVDTPPRGDPVLSALSEAQLKAYETLPTYRDAVNGSIAKEKVKIPSYQVNKQNTALVRLASDDAIREDIGWPEFFVTPEPGFELIRDYFSSDKSPALALLEGLPYRRYNKNEPGRAVVPAFFAALMMRSGMIEGDAWNMQENGAAGCLTLAALALRNFILPEVEVIDDEGKVDQRRTDVFNHLVQEAHEQFGEGAGIEINPPVSDEEQAWMKCCTLDPVRWDRRDPYGFYEDHYDVLAMTAPSLTTVNPVKGNMFKLGVRKEVELKGRADINNSSHVISQNRRSIDRLIPVTQPRMKKSGLRLMTEYAVEDPADPMRPTMLDRWYRQDYACTTLGNTAAEPEAGWSALLQWKDANCQKVKLVPEGLIKMFPVAAELFDL